VGAVTVAEGTAVGIEAAEVGVLDEMVKGAGLAAAALQAERIITKKQRTTAQNRARVWVKENFWTVVPWDSVLSMRSERFKKKSSRVDDSAPSSPVYVLARLNDFRIQIYRSARDMVPSKLVTDHDVRPPCPFFGDGGIAEHIQNRID